ADNQRSTPRHSCSYCKYTTSLKGNLTRHVRTHTGSRPFRCKKCRYNATQIDHLITHTRMVHTDMKPYGCPFENCGYRAAQKAKVDRHFRKHTGEKPYQCPQCVYQAADKCVINKHIRRKH
ncbi:RE1-silencing transcription factor, partial [Aphelenchoides avenae]